MPGITGTTSNYLARVWRVEEGLPQNKVTAVIQTRDGYLWTGTYGGLARFDGVKFQIFDEKNTPVMHSRRVTSLYECEDGTLWIGFEDGAVATFKNGKFDPDQSPSGRIPRKVFSMISDEAGDVWLLSDNGMPRLQRAGGFIEPRV